MNIRELEFPPEMQRRYAAFALAGDCKKPSKLIRCCVANACLRVMITLDAGLLHMSVSHPRRYPTWDELKALRYTLLPDAKTFGILLPPAAQYVNLHPNCFHLYELPELHEA